MSNKNTIHRIDQLPVGAVFQQLRSTLHTIPAAILVAPPGAGKTTAVPLALLNEGWLSGQRMLLLAPRRLAARAAAHRMAALLNQKVGRTVGYRVRMESRVGPETRIEVITEGVLTRKLQSDPALTGVGLVIFDEFHERSLDADLGLALCLDIQGVLNQDLRLLVMSATLDPAPVASLLGDAPLLRCDGRMYPIETRYVDRPTTQAVEQAVARVIRQSVHTGEGNILVFLPGAAEIRRTARLLEEANLPSGWLIAPLYGNLPRIRQDAAILPPLAGQHKIVLATAIAETSLTIERITVVIDGGLQRAPRFDPGSGMTRLTTLPVSRASADQRRGRAGRLTPGICYRLWRQAANHTLVRHNRPEILDTDLAALALELAAWGLDSSEALDWMDRPPAAAFTHARDLLVDLHALDDSGKITPHGRQMITLPLHPRLAHMVLMAKDAQMGIAACDTAAVLSERDPLQFNGRWRDADLRLRLEAVHACRTGDSLDVHGCRFDGSRLRRILQVSAALQRRLGIKRTFDRSSDAGRLLAWAYPDRIARQRPGRPGRFLLTSGRGAFLDPSEPLSASEYIVAAHLDGDRREARIFLAAATDKDALLNQLAYRLRWRETVSWNSRLQAVSALRQLVLGAIILKTEVQKNPDSAAVMHAILTGIRENGTTCLPWTRALRTWQSRVMILARIDTRDEPWPDISDAALVDTLETWLAPYLSGMRRLSELTARILSDAMHNHLSWRQQQRLKELVPTHMTVPSGSRLPIDYSGSTPMLAVRIQEMFGLSQTPCIANGGMPLTLHLLSPASRPAQITRDLAGFWKNGYPDVKKELKGRYPKHYWPDDPLNATPTSRAKRRKKS